MKCRQFDRDLDAFLAAGLPSAQKRNMELHRDSCACCREQLRQWEALAIGARQLPHVAAPAGFEAALMRRIRAQEHRRWRYLFLDLPRPLVQTVAFASLAMVIGLSAVLLRSDFSADKSGLAELQAADDARFSQPIAIPAGDLASGPGVQEISSAVNREAIPLPAIPIRAGFRNYAIPQNAEYVDYLLKGTGNREVYVRLPRTILYYPPADNDVYYVRNISH
jgi:anti-sigma factor RsiW